MEPRILRGVALQKARYHNQKQPIEVQYTQADPLGVLRRMFPATALPVGKLRLLRMGTMVALRRSSRLFVRSWLKERKL